MALVNRENMDTVARKAEALRATRKLARETYMARQLAANIEVRRACLESDEIWAGPSRAERAMNAPVYDPLHMHALQALIIDSATMERETDHRATEARRMLKKQDLLRSRRCAYVALWQPLAR